MPTKIDWLRGTDGKPGETINPWGWGCYGPGGDAEHVKLCSYCYAKRLSRRKMNKCPQCQAFVPHWHADELDKPLHWKRPRRIFVESMGDPFGSWVTDDQITQVFAMMAVCSWHTFYLLTKQPQNVAALLTATTNSPLPNVWIGASVDTQERLEKTVGHMWDVESAGWHTFASIEPMLTAISSSVLWADWVIIGAMTGSGAAKHQPDPEWVRRLLGYLDWAHTPVFVKSSLSYVSNRQEWPK